MASLQDIRGYVFDRSDWDPAASPEAVTRVNTMIDLACQQLALEAPYLFYEEEVRFRTQPEQEGTAAQTVFITTNRNDATGDMANNPWVLHTTLDHDASGAFAWPIDRTWDGRWIDLLDTTTGGIVHRSQIRTVAKSTDGAFKKNLIVLENPVNDAVTGAGPWKWRVYTPVYWLDDDVIQWRSGRIMGDNGPRPFEVLGQAEAEQRALQDEDINRGTGFPRFVFRRFSHRMRGLNTALAVSLGNPATTGQQWMGPEPPGKFQYLATLTWGKRHHEHWTSKNPGSPIDDIDDFSMTGQGFVASTEPDPWVDNRRREPLFESPPCPVSAEITVTSIGTTTTFAPAVRLVMPSIHYMLGMGRFGEHNGTTWWSEETWLSGVNIRIYRRRLTEDFTNYATMGTSGNKTEAYGSNVLYNPTLGVGAMDISDAFHLLAEVPAIQEFASVWWDTGKIIPDHQVRLKDVHSYAGFRMHPAPDAEYDCALRVLKRPSRLVNDTDVPNINPEAIDVVVQWALAYLYEHMKDYGAATQARALAEERLTTLSKRYGDMRPENEVVYRKAARSRLFRGIGHRSWRRNAS